MREGCALGGDRVTMRPISSLGWQMEALGDKTASVGDTKVKRRIATLLRVRKSEAVIINNNVLPWEFIIVLICSLLGLHSSHAI